MPPTATPTPTATLVPPTATPAPEPITLDIVDVELLDKLIAVGTTITWINTGRLIHTTTAGTPPSNLTGVWDSNNLRANEDFTFTFTEVGQFDYFCKRHPSLMTATITVVEEGSPQLLITPTSTPSAQAALPDFGY